tara:strand:+ start:1488 stop:2330 length:843 start_codon:yes stop_codon:yes gene_type:complete
MIQKILHLVKLQHSLFAMPFTLAAMIMASEGLPSSTKIFLIILAFMGARSFGMAANRLIDREIDAKNPRTAHRLMASGQIKPMQLVPYMMVFAAMLVISAYQLGEWPTRLLPLCFFIMILYPYTKRFTVLAHTILGVVLGLAPIGAWLAVVDAWHLAPVYLALSIIVWVNGFDIIYAIQDMEFDKKENLRSIPARLGKKKSLMIALLLHINVPIFWFLVGLELSYGLVYFTGIGVLSLLLGYEHLMVHKGYRENLGLVFFKLNSIISVGYLATIILQIYL